MGIICIPALCSAQDSEGVTGQRAWGWTGTGSLDTHSHVPPVWRHARVRLALGEVAKGAETWEEGPSGVTRTHLLLSAIGWHRANALRSIALQVQLIYAIR